MRGETSKLFSPPWSRRIPSWNQQRLRIERTKQCFSAPKRKRTWSIYLHDSTQRYDVQFLCDEKRRAGQRRMSLLFPWVSFLATMNVLWFKRTSKILREYKLEHSNLHCCHVYIDERLDKMYSHHRTPRTNETKIMSSDNTCVGRHAVWWIISDRANIRSSRDIFSNVDFVLGPKRDQYS